MSELSILIPDEQITLRDGFSINMRPCRIKQLREILGIVARYVDKLAQTDDTLQLAKYLLDDSGEQGLQDVYFVLKATTSVDDDEVFDNLLYDELILLVCKFLEMNKDFFKRVSSKMKGTEQKPIQSSKKTGEKSSPA